MDCKDFRDNHCAFVDDTLPGIELVRMQMHLTECGRCSQHDSNVRRSLMLFRNLKPIEPSADFSARLQKKLDAARIADAEAQHSGRTRRFRATVAVTSVVMLGYIGFSLREVDSPRALTLAPVVASAPATSTVSEPMTSPAPEMVASVPAGLPIWTAALFAEQTPVRFVSVDLAISTR